MGIKCFVYLKGVFYYFPNIKTTALNSHLKNMGRKANKMPERKVTCSEERDISLLHHLLLTGLHSMKEQTVYPFMGCC